MPHYSWKRGQPSDYDVKYFRIVYIVTLGKSSCSQKVTTSRLSACVITEPLGGRGIPFFQDNFVPSLRKYSQER